MLIDDGSHAYVYADGPLAQIDTSNNRQYLLTDALNSVRGLSDNSGTLVGSVNYNVFGGIRSQSGATSALGFTGELYNPQTQLLHLRARDYAVALGRLLSADTVSPNALPTDYSERIQRIFFPIRFPITLQKRISRLNNPFPKPPLRSGLPNALIRSIRAQGAPVTPLAVRSHSLRLCQNREHSRVEVLTLALEDRASGCRDDHLRVA